MSLYTRIFSSKGPLQHALYCRIKECLLNLLYSLQKSMSMVIIITNNFHHNVAYLVELQLNLLESNHRLHYASIV